METVLFVCTGNTCRSPMAEGFFRCQDGQGKTGLAAASAGLYTTGGMPASEYAVTAARERGADISRHRSRLLNRDILDNAKYIFCMTAAHYDHLLEQYPEAQDKAYLLADADIADPFGGDLMTYRIAADELYEAVRTVIAKLAV